MTSFDHVTTDPILDTLMQTQYLLFAAALFIGCTIFDAQVGTHAPQPPAPAAHKAVSPEDQQLFAEALRLYRAGQWPGAYGRFIALADRGDAQAARMALAMHRDGPSVYGRQWDASLDQLRAWERSAAQAGAPLVLTTR
jgi:hypothetical protein